MKRPLLTIWLALFATALFSCKLSATAAPAESFMKANDEFAAGHFREAVDLYESVVQAGEPSAAVFYNLGNARFRTGELGRAILNYERALALEPHHPEAEANLRIAREKARALELRKSWQERTANWTTASNYSLAAAVAFWIAAFGFAGGLLARRRARSAYAIAALAVVLCAAALCGLYALETGSSGRAVAIITAPKIEARLATADNAATVLALPTGSEVKILSTRGGWIYAALPNDLRGWIPASSAEPVRL